MIKTNFPIFKNNPTLTYLDNAATTQKPESVIERLKYYYENENANVHRGIYRLSETATEEYENARKTVTNFINAKSEKEIIFTSGTTDSINLVAYSWLRNNLKPNDTVLTTQMEHHSNFIPWQQAVKSKAKFELVNVADDYTLDLTDLEEKLSKFQPKIFALTQISNLLGTLNPIKEIVAVKNKVSPKTRILLDAAQSIAHIPVNVQELGIDFLAFSGHKIYGPTGIGVLWAKEEILDKEMLPFRYGGGMIQSVEIEDSTWAELPAKFEGGTPNIAGAIGLAEAIRFVEKVGFDEIMSHERDLTKYAIEQLKQISEIKILGPLNLDNRTGVISIHIDKIHPHDIAQILDEDNICVRAGHHCNQILTKHVLKVPATTRISLGIYNEESDIDRLIEGLKRIVKLFRR